MKIMKFGGTSVGSAEGIRRIRRIVQAEESVIVVVSAFSRVTDILMTFRDAKQLSDEDCRLLITRHDEVTTELWPEGNERVQVYVAAQIDRLQELLRLPATLERHDSILAIGETISSFIVSQYITEVRPCRQLLATECIITNDEFGNAEVLDEPTRKAVSRIIRQHLSEGAVIVATGFIGATMDGRTTTLGRGGSDYSAALFGYYVGAEEIQIWTDVDGVLSTDPRIVREAVLLQEISYGEAAELAAFGAKVIHPKTMRPAVHAGIPLRILNTFGNSEGTVVSEKTASEKLVTAVASKARVMMVNVHAVEMLQERGFLARIAQVFAQRGISVDIVSASETSVSVTLDNSHNLAEAIKDLEQFSQVEQRDDVGLVSLIGSKVTRPIRMQYIFMKLADLNLETAMVSVGAMGINVSLVVDAERVNELVHVMHKLCGSRA